MKQIFSVCLCLLLFGFMMQACSKSNDSIPDTPTPADSSNTTKPVDTDSSTNNNQEKKSAVYEFIGLDSGDYHYLTGSPAGGIDKSKENPPSLTFRTALNTSSISLIKESREDSLSLSDSVLTSYVQGTAHKSYYYKIIKDTLYFNYDISNYNGQWESVGLFNKTDSILSLVLPAISMYDAEYQVFSSSSLTPGSFGFIKNVFAGGSNFSSQKDMLNADDLLIWINLKLNYKIKKE